MIFNLSIFGAHVAMAATSFDPSFDVNIPMSDRSLETTCVTDVMAAVKLWSSNYNSAVNTYGNIESWCTKDVTSFYYMFYLYSGNQKPGGNHKTFNENISSWDTSSSVNFREVFRDAESFNGDVSSWDTSKGTTFESMFHNCYVFDQDLSNWDVSNGKQMWGMFNGARVFNQDITGWDTSKVEVMAYMFAYTKLFNQKISRWDVSSNNYFSYMFHNAEKFGQCLKWDINTPDRIKTGMFTGSNGAFAGDNCPTPDTTQPTFKHKPSSTPTILPTSKPSSNPTNLMETINKYNITMKEMSLDSSNFTLTTTYIVSDITSIDQSKITIMDKNCNLTYGGVVADTSVNDTSPVISEGSIFFDGSSLSATFKIDRFSLETSVLTSAVRDVNKSIAGELHFCLKTEIINGGVSLNFRESNIVLEYDLSANTFSVSGNKAEKEAIITSTKSVSNIYSIKACRCGKISYGCLTDGEKLQSLNQDSLIHVCLKPNSTDVTISKLYMQFLKHGTNQVDFEPVRNSIGVTGSSVVLGTGTVSAPFKVTSRLITESFANGATKFDIKGDAVLQFNSNNRILSLRSSDRTLQVEVADAGTAPYKMSVDIVGKDISEIGFFTTVFSNTVVIGCFVLVLFIVIVMYKKVS